MISCIVRIIVWKNDFELMNTINIVKNNKYTYTNGFFRVVFVLHEKVFTDKKKLQIVVRPTGKHSSLPWRSEIRLPKCVSIVTSKLDHCKRNT